MSDRFIPAIIIVSTIAIFTVCFFGSQSKSDLKTQCTEKGGVLIETVDTYVCIKKDSFLN